MNAMSQYDYVNTDIDISELVRGPKGLRLEAKAAYKEGWAMLSVYGFWVAAVKGRLDRTSRIVLYRMFVPRDTPKVEKHRMLRTMCDLFAVQHGEAYYLRSKLK
jgi:hypothetical protein